MTYLRPFAVMLCLALPTGVVAEEIAATEGPVRPDDAEGTALPSDGLAECAAILAVASSRSKNLPQRNNMEIASGGWFAASGDLALEEGELPAAEVWGEKVAKWAGQIGSVDSMTRYPDWMAYCSAVGGQHGLDSGHFPKPA